MMNLTAQDFIKEFGDPESYYKDVNRVTTERYKRNVRKYIREHFPHLQTHKFQSMWDTNNGLLVPMFQNVKNLPNKGKGKGRKSPTIGNNEDEDDQGEDEEKDLEFLKELSFIRLEQEIKETIEDRRDTIARAVANGEVFECCVCFEEDCLKAEMIVCEKGCKFCPGCVKKGAEIQMGQSKSKILCLMLTACGGEIAIKDLTNVLTEKQVKKLESMKQQEELKAAGIENLFNCHACNFAVIIDPDNTDKVVMCQNPDCGQETCRSCGERSHIPLSCLEAENDSEVRARTRVENAMTEAMLRECPRCKNKFYKVDGCNSMRCPCGQAMCYVCKQPLATEHDPRHFGPGKCPMSSDTADLHKNEVLGAANKVKETIEAGQLKNDPTKNYKPDRPGRGQGFAGIELAPPVPGRGQAFAGIELAPLDPLDPLGPEPYRGQGFEYVPHGPGLGGTLRILNGGRFINVNHYPPRFAQGRRAVMGRPNDPLDLRGYNPVPPDYIRRLDDELALANREARQREREEIHRSREERHRSREERHRSREERDRSLMSEAAEAKQKRKRKYECKICMVMFQTKVNCTFLSHIILSQPFVFQELLEKHRTEYKHMKLMRDLNLDHSNTLDTDEEDDKIRYTPPDRKDRGEFNLKLEDSDDEEEDKAEVKVIEPEVKKEMRYTLPELRLPEFNLKLEDSDDEEDDKAEVMAIVPKVKKEKTYNLQDRKDQRDLDLGLPDTLDSDEEDEAEVEVIEPKMKKKRYTLPELGLPENFGQPKKRFKCNVCNVQLSSEAEKRPHRMSYAHYKKMKSLDHSMFDPGFQVFSEVDPDVVDVDLEDSDDE